MRLLSRVLFREILVSALLGAVAGLAGCALLALTVPAGVGAGLITVSTAGGSSTLRTGNTTITALAERNIENIIANDMN